MSNDYNEYDDAKMICKEMHWTLKQAEDGVRQVRNQLASGELNGKFDLSIALETEECGTVGCIGGWMIYNRRLAETGERLTRLWNIDGIIDYVREEDNDRANGLSRLLWLFPDRTTSIIETIEACDRWLAGNNDPWQEGD